jgi:hypothetical protein
LEPEGRKVLIIAIPLDSQATPPPACNIRQKAPLELLAGYEAAGDGGVTEKSPGCLWQTIPLPDFGPDVYLLEWCYSC